VLLEHAGNGAVRITTTICGSFHEPNLSEVVRVIWRFRRLGIPVLSPIGRKPIEVELDFVRFRSKVTEAMTEEKIEELHLEKIAESTFSYFVLTRGYVGSMTAMELRYAAEAGKPRFCSELPSDPHLRKLIDMVATPEEVSHIAWQFGFDLNGNHSLHIPIKLKSSP